MPPLALATLFLAQTQTPAATPAASGGQLDAGNPIVFMGLLVGAVLTILTVVDKVDGMVQRRKRVPSVEAEFAKKEELTALDRRITTDISNLRSNIGETNGKLDLLAVSMNHEFRDLARALGKLEGKTGE